MSMSHAMELRRRGFGAFEPGWDAELGDPPPFIPSGTIGSSAGDDNNDIPWWVSGAPVIGIIGKTVSNIFSPWQATAAQAQGAYRPQQTNYPVNTLPVNRNSGVGIGVDSNGVRLSDGSHLGWFPIVGVIGAFFLLQSKGFSRR
jgi:hypothetical protein